MSVRFKRVAVLGLGLLGGSVALAARQRGVADSVVGVGRRPGPLQAALAKGVIDEVAEPAAAVRGSDLVVLCTPVGAMPGLVQSVAESFEPGALVTDVGSVKTTLAEILPGLLPSGVEYVGAHPMAGSHLRGVHHAQGNLFDGACCILTPQPSNDPAAVARVSAFWRALGARVVERDPVTHDEEVAWMSHVPHVLAFAFARALAKAPAGAGELAGSGFRDFTRIAQSDAELWGDILSANRKTLAGHLHAFSAALAELAAAIERGDTDAQESFLAAARDTLAASQSFGQGGSGRDGGEDSSAPDPEANDPEIQGRDQSRGHP